MSSNKKYPFKYFHKALSGKHFDKILWTADMNQNSRPEMKDYLNYVKSLDIYEEYNDKLFNLTEYDDYKIIGLCQIGNSEYMYLITNKLYKVLYLSIEKTHPIFWYKFKTKKLFIENFDSLYETYNSFNFPFSFKKQVKGFMGNESILNVSIHDIENHLLLNKNTDKLIWGSKWSDHPFRYKYNNATHMDSIIFTGQAMRQMNDDIYSVSVRTIFSKSIITFYDYDGTFVVEIDYDPLNKEISGIIEINNLFKRNYETDIPVDVIATLINFPFLDFTEILKIKPLNEYYVYILTLLTIGNVDHMNIALNELNKMIENNEITEDIIDDVDDLIDHIKNNSLTMTIIKEINIDEIDDTLFDKLVSKYGLGENTIAKKELSDYIALHLGMSQKIDF